MAKGDISTNNEGGTWKSKVEGSSRAAHTGGTKAQQEAVGRQMAKDRAVEHTVRNVDGTDRQEELVRQRPQEVQGLIAGWRFSFTGPGRDASGAKPAGRGARVVR